MNLASLREQCGSFPGVTEDIKRENNLCFLVGGKMFCVTGLEVLCGAILRTHYEQTAGEA